MRGSWSVPEWLEGAVDIHVHSSPSIFPRLLDDREVARQATKAKMRAVVLKAHEGATVARAQLAEDTVTDIMASTALAVRGGVVLNHFVGGLNPVAVELALGMAGETSCIVWMPTIHAQNHIAYYGEAGFKEQKASYQGSRVTPLTILDERERLKPEVLDILELVASHPKAVLNNGHLSAPETAHLFREARARGLERLVVAHPELPLTGYSLDFQLEMARLGAYIERCYLPHLPHWGGFPLARTVAEIKQIGPERCVLSTDFGQRDNLPPTEGLEQFCRALLEHGLAQSALEQMVKRNPARLLSLS
jgi:hypothetical protein